MRSVSALKRVVTRTRVKLHTVDIVLRHLRVAEFLAEVYVNSAASEFCLKQLCFVNSLLKHGVWRGS